MANVAQSCSSSCCVQKTALHKLFSVSVVAVDEGGSFEQLAWMSRCARFRDESLPCPHPLFLVLCVRPASSSFSSFPKNSKPKSMNDNHMVQGTCIAARECAHKTLSLASFVWVQNETWSRFKGSCSLVQNSVKWIKQSLPKSVGKTGGKALWFDRWNEIQTLRAPWSGKRDLALLRHKVLPGNITE